MKIKTIFSLLWVLLTLTLLLTACQSVPKIHSLYDQSVNLNQYTTYGFHPSLHLEGEEYDTLSTRYIKAAITREMQQRGYRFSDNPDLWVNFNTYTKEKLRVIDTPSHHPYYFFRYDYRVWGGYPLHETRIDQYTEGTLNIDVIDRSTNTLLWEGIAVGRLSKRTMDNLELKINEAVRLIFEQFPKQ